MIFIDFLKFLIFLILIFSWGQIAIRFLKLKLKSWENILISINLGIINLVLVVYLINILGIKPILSFVILIPLIYLLIKKDFSVVSLKKLDVKLITSLLLSVSLTGILCFFSGDVVNGQIRLIGAHSHDGLWHLSLINQIKQQIPPNNPIYADTMVQNYHYFTDIFISLASTLTGISVVNLYFKIIPLFFSLIFFSTIFVVTKKITEDINWSYFAILFVGLSSNLFYMFSLFYPNAYVSPSVFWVDEYSTRMVNPQLLISYVVILTFAYLILVYKKTFDFRFTLIASLVILSLIGFKVYGFILLFSSFLILNLIYIIKKNYEGLKILIGASLGSLILYLTSSLSKESVFIFSPFWFIKVMFETPDHLANSVWELKRQTYLEHKNYLRIAQLYLEGTVVFILGNLGGRLIGFLAIFNYAGKKADIVLLFWVISLLGTILPFLFIQKGGAWNTIQFFYYPVIFTGLLTIIVLQNFANKHKILSLILLFVMFLSFLPGVIYTTLKFIPSQNHLYGTKDLHDAVSFLKNEQNSSGEEQEIVLLNPLYTGDAFIPASSEKTPFYTDETNLHLLLINFGERKKQTENFFNNTSSSDKLNFLKENDIKYIFTQNLKEDNLKFKGIKRIYQNKEVIIYQVL